MSLVYIDATQDTWQTIEALDPAMAKAIRHYVGDPLDEEELEARCRGARGVLNGHTVMSDALLERLAPTLKVVVFIGIGASSYVNPDTAQRLGIDLRAVPGYGNRTIAEHAFALLLSAARRLCIMDRKLRAGVWGAEMGVELEGKTLGVVGAGGSGQALIKIAHGFGMKVLAWNRSPIDPALPCEAVSLEKLFERADAVSLHLASTPETEGLIDGRLLQCLRPGALFINTARGALVDEEALAEACLSGQIAQAVLDVYSQEPLPANSPLLQLDNVIFSSHAAWKTPEASRRLLQRSLEELQDGMARLVPED